MEESSILVPLPNDPDNGYSIIAFMIVLGAFAFTLILTGSIILLRRLELSLKAAWLAGFAHACATALLVWKTVWLTDFISMGLAQFLSCLLAFFALSVAFKSRAPRTTLKVFLGALVAGVGTTIMGYLLTWIALSWPDLMSIAN